MGKKNNPPKERDEETKELFALWKRLDNAKPGKEAREIHKQLKKYGDGVPLFYRYPWLPYVPALVMSITSLIISIVQLLR